MTLDLIALLVLGAFVAAGAWRGTIATGRGVLGLLLAYVGAVLCAQHGSGAAAQYFTGPAILAPALAGSVGFLAAIVVWELATSWLKRWDRDRLGGDPRSPVDRIGGGVFGAFRGGLIVLLLSLLFTWLDAARDMNVMQGLESFPQTENSRVSDATGDLIEGLITSSVSEGESGTGARIIGRIVARPTATLGQIQALLEDERLQELQDDKLFWVLVENGAGERAINQSSFYRILHDDEMRGRMAQVGLVSEAAARDTDVFRIEMAAMLDELGPRIKGLREDPELLKLADDPEIVAMLQAGDTLALMTHPGIRRVVTRVAAAD